MRDCMKSNSIQRVFTDVTPTLLLCYSNCTKMEQEYLRAEVSWRHLRPRSLQEPVPT